MTARRKGNVLAFTSSRSAPAPPTLQLFGTELKWRGVATLEWKETTDGWNVVADAPGEISKDQRVVVISTAHGLKFADQKADYHAGKLSDIDGRWANQPLELANDPGVVRDALLRELDRRQKTSQSAGGMP